MSVSPAVTKSVAKSGTKPAIKPIVPPAKPGTHPTGKILPTEASVCVIGSNGSILEIGTDDEQIQTDAIDNYFELEQEDKKADGSVYTYVVTREMNVVKPTKCGQGVRAKESRPHNVVYAASMWKAIQSFEEDNGKRLWLPDGKDRQECQIGFARLATDMYIIRIQKMSRDAILKN